MASIVMALRSILPIAFATIGCISSLSLLPVIEGNNIGFSVDLIHRDSPASPFYISSLTHFDRVSNALQRSFDRAKYFTLTSTPPKSASTDVISNDGEYLMKIGIGTPQFNILAIADTGSDLTWTQCRPCKNCFKQKASLFNPKGSSTYKEVPCHSRQCQTIAKTSCHNNGSCAYSMSYGDRSYSRGILAKEKVTLGSTDGRSVSLSGIIFGCGYDNGGTFLGNGSGIIGLGGGRASMIYQMSPSIGGKFSYCLLPISSQSIKASKMHFGDNAIVSGNRVVSTPMLGKSPSTFYFLKLEGFTVGSQKLRFYDSSSSKNASGPTLKGKIEIIIDSGTTLTYLPSDFYSQLEAAVKSQIRLKPIPDPQNRLNLCYGMRNNITIPLITAHFAGADVNLNPFNTFIRTRSDILCLAFAPAKNIAIYGNVAQMNFLIGYDLTERTVSFKPTNCARP
ncbi:Aspartic endopeptidase [Sarracenia purpurea var. burkii]